MSRPLVATYRLQFREGVGFEQAEHLVPYLRKLGVSHLYASPIFAAAPGSTHGYDVVDYNRFEEELGGDAGFQALSDALGRHGLGLILDFVPNHMGIAQENPWWEDVLRWGPESRHAKTFDISWEADKILVPTLAKPYGTALRDGDLSVVFDEDRRRLRFDAFGHQLPLDPRTLSHVFAFLDHEDRDHLIRRFLTAVPGDGDELDEILVEHASRPRFVAALRRALEAINDDRTALHELHEAQAWRLAWWRLSREKLSYRRFFEITGLIGVRQETRRVFRESHRTVLRLAREGRLDGIRIDHVDGIADPKTYLSDLRQSFQSVGRRPVIHVEKILTGDERLRTSWAVEGTTGYEFITALSGLYVDASREEAMSGAYAAFVGEEEDLEAIISGQKRFIFGHNLAGELAFLADEALRVAAGGLETRDFGRDAISRSIVEVAAALPVYRTYVGIDGVPEKDRALIDSAVSRAQAGREVEAGEPVAFIGRLLELDFEDHHELTGALNFTRRFQQTTGAVMAKALEDTVFYRYNRLIACNEVGGDPGRHGADVGAFHRAMQIRLEDQPEGLLATSTHDTKRGEDARARLYTLSEAPETWAEIVAEAAAALEPFRQEIEPGLVSPDPATEWGFYQSLLGVLPADFDPADEARRREIAGRLTIFMEKAVREAGRFTSWTAPSEAYEHALAEFVRAAMSRERTGDFLAEFWERCQPFVAAGALNSLSQTLLKMTAPGVPDLYQGTEFYDYSLVDPDNRRPIDFEARARAMMDDAGLAAALPRWRDGQVKAALTFAALQVRSAAPRLYTRGDYLPLEIEGARAEHVVAFARVDREGRAAIVIAPRLTLRLLEGRLDLLPPGSFWEDTAVRLPSNLERLEFADALGSVAIEAGPWIGVSSLFEQLPFALRVATDPRPPSV